jgi:hypothetical protein
MDWQGRQKQRNQQHQAEEFSARRQTPTLQAKDTRARQRQSRCRTSTLLMLGRVGKSPHADYWHTGYRMRMVVARPPGGGAACRHLSTGANRGETALAAVRVRRILTA